jgi:magnesium-transporting ATPase (P-type)
MPNADLDNWEAVMSSNKLKREYPGSIKNLLLRGCYLRNVDMCYGIVIYVGMNTKIMKNTKKPPSKMSDVMKKMNKMLYTVFFFQLIIILLFATLSMKWRSDEKGKHGYFGAVSINSLSIGRR